MKKITCFTSNLSGGGAEHQLVQLSNFLAEVGYEITIVTYNNIPDHYVLDNRIKRVQLNVDGKPNFLKQWIISRYFWGLKTDCIVRQIGHGTQGVLDAVTGQSFGNFRKEFEHESTDGFAGAGRGDRFTVVPDLCTVFAAAPHERILGHNAENSPCPGLIVPAFQAAA